MMNRSLLYGVFLAAMLSSIAPCATAHVKLLTPDGGQVLAGSEYYPITWEVVVNHVTIDWKVYYSTDSRSGPWVPIITDYPAGDTAIGTQHTHYWLVPEIEAPEAWILVVQHNVVRDWADTSLSSFSISGSCCNGERGNIDGDPLESIDITDLVRLVGWMFRNGPSPACRTEADVLDTGDNSIDISDLGRFVDFLFRGGSPLPSCP